MAASVWQAVCDTFWSSSFWLPTGYTWNDLQNNSTDIYYPRVQDINWSFVVGLFMLLIRYVYESVVIVPIAEALGIKNKKRHVTPNPVLEKAYKDHRGKVPTSVKESLAKKTELSVRQIERWFYKRYLKDAPTSLKKFKECSWHFLFYFSAFVYGIYVFWDKNWFWDIRYCFEGWPNHHVDWSLYILCLGEIGFYWSLLFTSFSDPKRLDFWEMTIHHVITIGLIYFSWVINFVRIGALIIIVHDVADYWVAAAKLAKYSKRQTVCEILFVGFFISWNVSRMIVFPFWILKSIIYELPKYVPPFISLKAFFVCLCTLQVLHMFWTYLIWKMALQKFTKGSLVKDVRSDPESDEDDSSSEDSESQTVVMNGTKKLVSRNNNVG